MQSFLLRVHQNYSSVILEIHQKCMCHELYIRCVIYRRSAPGLHNHPQAPDLACPAASSWRQEPEGTGCRILASDYFRPQLCHPTTDALITHQGHPRHNWVHKVRQLYFTIACALPWVRLAIQKSSQGSSPSKSLIGLNFWRKFQKFKTFQTGSQECFKFLGFFFN